MQHKLYLCRSNNIFSGEELGRPNINAAKMLKALLELVIYIM